MNVADHQLAVFYNAHTYPDLVRAMEQHIHRLQVALNKAAPDEKIAVTPLSDERIMEVARKHWKSPGRDVIDFVRELLG